MLDAFWSHWSRLLNGRLVVVVYYRPSVCFRNSDIVGTMIQLLKFCGKPVDGHDFDFIVTKVIWFWRIDFHAIGIPERQMRKPDKDRNLNSSRGVTSLTALRNWPPHQVPQKAASWWNSDGEGSVYPVYASLSWLCGKFLNACIVEDEFELKDIPY